MTIEFFLAPNARWQGRDLTGQPCSNGKLYTYETGTVIPKNTYSDYLGVNPNSNPVELDDAGEANIYWANDALYTIALYDVDDFLVYTQDNYPIVDSTDATPVIVFSDNDNLIRNPQFTFWSNTDSFPGITTSANQYDFIADDWVFSRSNTNGTINISKGTFNLGQVDVPASPVYYLHYECNNTGVGGETWKHIEQYYQSVQTLANTEVSIAIVAKSSSLSPITVTFTQYFGSGGSPSAPVETIALATTVLTNEWARYTAVVTIPNIVGKVIGTNGDDALIFQVNPPLNSIASVDIVNAQFHDNSEIIDFPYLTQDEQYKRINSIVNYGLAKTGDCKFTLRTVADKGWVLCNDTTIGNSLSGAATAALYTKALFELIWDGVSNLYAPVYTSAGAVSTRGANAEADYNANKRLALTKQLGRVIAGYSPSPFTVSKTFTAAVTTDNRLTVDDATSYLSGTPVTLTTTVTLPAPLALATTYYSIYIDSTHIKLATTLVNALSATPVPIAITTTGTGIHTVTTTFPAHALGSYLGEEGHSLSASENAPHIHGVDHMFVNSPEKGMFGGDYEPWEYDITAGINPTTSQGSGTAHNNLQPTVYLNCMIKL